MLQLPALAKPQRMLALRSAEAMRMTDFEVVEPYTIVTFIIPTVGRYTLRRAVDSLLAQTDPHWKCIIVGDGIKPDIGSIKDERIKCFEEPHLAHESTMRNRGIARAGTHWVAFLDDDDTLAPQYVEWLWDEEVESDVVIFRQSVPTEDGATVIFPREEEIVWGNVGISYAVTRDLAVRFPFKRSRHEDLLHLAALEAAGAVIRYSPHIAYYGRDRRA